MASDYTMDEILADFAKSKYGGKSAGFDENILGFFETFKTPEVKALTGFGLKKLILMEITVWTS